MNLTPYNDNYRLNGYYPQVTREGELIEDTPAYIERAESRNRFYAVIFFGMFIIAMFVFVHIVSMRNDFLLATYVLDYQERKEKREAEERKEIFNFRKFIGVSK